MQAGCSQLGVLLPLGRVSEHSPEPRRWEAVAGPNRMKINAGTIRESVEINGRIMGFCIK